jgi:hypothetical protein
MGRTFYTYVQPSERLKDVREHKAKVYKPLKLNIIQSKSSKNV